MKDFSMIADWPFKHLLPYSTRQIGHLGKTEKVAQSAIFCLYSLNFLLYIALFSFGISCVFSHFHSDGPSSESLWCSYFSKEISSGFLFSYVYPSWLNLMLLIQEGKRMQLLLNVGGLDRVSRVQMAEAVAQFRGHDSSLIKPVSASSVSTSFKSHGKNSYSSAPSLVVCYSLIPILFFCSKLSSML